VSLEIRSIESPAELIAIARSWNGLYERQAQPVPSMDCRWFHTFWTFMNHGASRVVVLTAWRGDELVGAAPLRIRSHRIAGVPWGEVTGLENAHSPAYGWLLSPEPREAEEAARTLVRAVGDSAGRRHAITWDNMPVTDPAGPIVVRVLRETGYHVALRPRRVSTVIRFPDGAEAYFASLNRGMRRRFKRGWKNLRMTGRTSFEVEDGSPELLSRLDEAWRLESSTWKGAAGSSVGQDAAVRSFYDALAAALAPPGRMRLCLLRCDGELAAFAYIILDRGLIHGLKLSYSPRFAAASPGYLVLWKTIEWAEAQGFSQFNLSGVTTEWKSHWRGEPVEIDALGAFSPDPVGTGAYMARVGWKEFVKRLPGTRWIARGVAEGGRKSVRSHPHWIGTDVPDQVGVG
jgi:CelD/BcsL family acetyltransferase involved in cellulose biosynthesis